MACPSLNVFFETQRILFGIAKASPGGAERLEVLRTMLKIVVENEHLIDCSEEANRKWLKSYKDKADEAWWRDPSFGVYSDRIQEMLYTGPITRQRANRFPSRTSVRVE